MRISDWSSDVCSSDLALAHQPVGAFEVRLPTAPCAFAIHRDVEIQHFDRNNGPLMSITFGVEKPCIGEHVSMVILCHDGFTRCQLDDTASTPKIGREPCRERVCQYV